MIKWIKSLIEKVFGKKEEPIILEDEDKYFYGIEETENDKV